MRHLHCFWLVAVMLAGGHADSQPALDRVFGQLVRDGFRGQVVIARGAHVVYERAGGRGVHPSTLFYVASITKSLTATAIFKLRDEGKLSLTDPITRFFHNVPPDKQAITVADLLTHTSGYTDNYAADGFTDRDAAVAAVMARPMKGQVGKDFNYSNDNYALLGAIVEITSGMRYEDYLRKEVFTPAGVELRFWGSITPKDATRLAPFSHPMIEARRIRNWGDLGSSGVLMTARDLYRWGTALMRGRIVAPSTVTEMQTTKLTSSSGTNIASGWFSSTSASGRKVIFSRGQEDVGHNAILEYFPEDNVTIVVTSGSDEFKGEGWNRVASKRLEEAYFGAR